MPQSQQRQQSGSSDLQFWQQQLMYKQLQELEQRQQIPQINQIAMQQNSLGQLSTSRKLSADMLPPLHNGMPINNVPYGAWQNEFVGNDQLKMLNNSQRFPGNRNWAQSSMHGLQNGIVFTNDRGQSMQSMSFISQQADQSLHGMPVSINRSSCIPYTHVEGHANVSNSLFSKASENQNAFQSEYGVFAEQGNSAQDSMLLASHGFRGNGHFSDNQSQTRSNGNMKAESYQDNQSHSSHVQKAQNWHGPDWLENSADKLAVQANTSHGVSSLDPTEKKLLFGLDDDDSLDASFSRSVIGGTGAFVGNSSGNENYFGGSPSFQSGSFSALMLDALDATTSENAVREEWSGLSFPKSEAFAGNHSSSTNGNTSAWNGNKIQNQSSMSSRAGPFYNEAEGGVLQTGPEFQLSSGTFVYEQNERLPADASAQKQGLKEGDFMHLDQKLLQKQLGTSGLEAFAPINVASASGRELPSSNMHSVLSHQKNLLQSNISGGYNQKQDCSNMTEMQVSSGNDTSNFHRHTDQEWHSQACDMNWSIHANLYQDDGVRRIERNQVDPTRRMDAPKPDLLSSKIYDENHFAVKNSNMFNRIQEKSNQMGSIQQPKFGIHDDSFEKANTFLHSNQHQPSNGPVLDPFVNSRALGQASNNKQEDRHPQRVSDELHVSESSNPINLSDAGNVPAEKPVFTQYNVHNIDRTQVDHDQNWLMLQRFRHPTMGNVLVNTNSPLNAQGVTQLRGSNDQASIVQSQYLGRAVAENSMGKGQLSDIRRSVEGPDDTQSVDSVVRNDSSGISSPFEAKADPWSQKMEIGRTRQNMLELLQKVDQPLENTGFSQVNFSRHNASEITETTGFNPQTCPSAVYHGFGLRLSPPTESHSSGTPELSNKTYSRDTNINQLEKEVSEEKPPLLPSEATPQKESLGHESIVSGHMPARMMPVIHGSSSASNASFSFIGSHLQTTISSGSGQFEAMNRHGHTALTTQADHEELRIPTTNLRQSHDSYAGSVSNPPSLPASLSDVSGKILASGNASSDNYPHLSGQCQTHNTGQSQQVHCHYPHLNSQKQAPLFETSSISQASTVGLTLPSHSCLPGSQIPKQDSLPPMLHNVWKSVGPQRPTNVRPNELAPKIVQTSPPELREPDAPRDSSRAAPSGSGTLSVSSQQFTQRHLPIETVGGQNAVNSYQLHISERNPVSPAYHRYLDHGRHFNNSAENTFQQPSMPFQKGFPNQDVGIVGHNAKLTNFQQQKYSLLQQMQAIKGAHSEMGRVAIKQVKESELRIDEKNMDQKTSPLYIHGQNSVLKVPSDSDQRITRNNTFSPDSKVVIFPSRENEDTNSSSSFDFIPRELSSLDMHSRGLELQGTSQSLPQFEQCENEKNGQTLSMYDVLKNSGPLIKQHLLTKFAGNLDSSSMLLQRNDISRLSIVDRNAPTKVPAMESVSLHCESSYIMDHNELLRTKKRKLFTSELPWHKEVAHSPQRRRTIRIAELEWAHSVNRLIDKVEDDMETTEDFPMIPQSRRRLILTTQLMQQLIPPVPSQILTEARISYESMTYYIARSALGDACSMNCELGSDHSVEEQEGTMHDLYSNDVERFLDRSRKLQSLSQRLFGTFTSLLDLRLECQDLERFSIVNSLAKFHGRNQAEASAERASGSGPSLRRIYPQRYVLAIPVTGVLPEEVPCLPL